MTSLFKMSCDSFAIVVIDCTIKYLLQINDFRTSQSKKSML